jgi:FkbM family methyltransferase
VWSNLWVYLSGTVRFFVWDFGLRQLWRWLTSRGSEMLVHLPGLAHPLHIRPTKPDILVLWQTFGLRQCAIDQPRSPALNAPKLIVDAGANIGCTAVFLARRYPQARIVAVEPEAANIALARKNTQFYQNVELVQGAVWPRPVELEIENPTGESWAFRMREVPRGAAVGPGGMKGLTIDELSGGQPVDLLKVDIEGGEKTLFAEETGWLARVGALLVELHGHDCAEAVTAAAHSNGFIKLAPRGEYHVWVRPPPS